MRRALLQLARTVSLFPKGHLLKEQEATRSKCIATCNKCISISSKKLLGAIERRGTWDISPATLSPEHVERSAARAGMFWRPKSALEHFTISAHLQPEWFLSQAVCWSEVTSWVNVDGSSEPSYIQLRLYCTLPMMNHQRGLEFQH